MACLIPVPWHCDPKRVVAEFPVMGTIEGLALAAVFLGLIWLFWWLTDSSIIDTPEDEQ